MSKDAFKYRVCVYMQVLATRGLQSQCNGALPHSTNTWTCGHGRKKKNQLIAHFVFFAKASFQWLVWPKPQHTPIVNLLQPQQKHLQETARES